MIKQKNDSCVFKLFLGLDFYKKMKYGPEGTRVVTCLYFSSIMVYGPDGIWYCGVSFLRSIMPIILLDFSLLK